MATATASASHSNGVIERAQALIPVLRERAMAASQARSIQAETIADYWDSGILNLMRPKKFGGPEMRIDDALAITHELARGDGSAAWIWIIISCHDFLAAYFPEPAQEEFWAKDRTVMASSFMPGGPAEPAKGGFTISGKWSFCSGVDHADWIMLGAVCGMLSENPPIPDIRFFLVPKGDYQIIDDWHVVGLRGTGSKSVAVDKAFVPEHRVIKLADLMEGRAPGAAVHSAPIYRAPIWTVFPFFISSPSSGIARGAVESFVEQMSVRDSSLDHSPMAMKPGVQLRLAEAAALADASELLYRRSLTETISKLSAGEQLSMDHRIRSRRDQAYATKMAKQSAEMLLSGMGGRGLYESNPVQRAFRDLQAIAGHLVAGWDMAGQQYGQVKLGGAPSDPVF